MVQEPHFLLIIEVGVHADGREEVRDGAGEVQVLEHEVDVVYLAWTTANLAPLAWVAMDLASINELEPQLGGGWRTETDEIGQGGGHGWAADPKP